ncbi:MAG TPA: type III pantothenate kinase [Gemmatimonadota bacterium]|nr:type III pantothenate kinase [Gemmatimonadota bacterium]
MLLVADIGNSSTVLGLWASDGRIVRRWRVRTDGRWTPDEAGVLLQSLLAGATLESRASPPVSLSGGCFASVVPPVTGTLVEAARRYLGIAVRPFRYAAELGIRLEVDEPGQVGADRVANTLAAHLAYPGPAIVVDFGTATNFDVVSADGAFLGGIIAPGLESGFELFAGRTALLPRVAPDFPASFIGRTTVTSLQIGVYRGATVMVDGLVAALRAEWDPGARVIATGGLAPLLAPHCRTVEILDPDLTLKGVGWGHDRLYPRTV